MHAQVNPHIKKEKWTDDEDDRLAMLVRQFGSAWAEIARRMRGRTDQQCMGRWRRHLDPSIRCLLPPVQGLHVHHIGQCTIWCRHPALMKNKNSLILLT